MNTSLLNRVFSFTGASIVIGVLGFMSGMVTLFVDINQTISIQWLLFAILLMTSVIIILLKAHFDIAQTQVLPQNYEIPIRYFEDENLFIIKKNESFVNNIIVGCYLKQNDIERLAYVGVIHLVQEKVIQIKIRADLGVCDKIPENSEALKEIVVRPVVPVTALEHFNSSEK